ncbi:uncharacterized protein TrAFT101_001601 [Trichoderma asperellum]|uniref:Uncharacterized protein n=1 Tax=Trichoderma asperellum (strain ATCC 204424 / CBS 433.97 / NBRC 101777) TaxID=1042311 RepID=A0A2T3ZE03_TRIA4|nr:hypothetical protein M441DRAFT_45042 [Trichoderma asperellum CBS 433.97]PTB43042.1 hypothetical protein M441DRAFT_45042 [Trichoderma asperellum CBS 433.97]UKZ85755.1 hypothetical protein TrAFT101_001601 [Trichoderma asperellum]
MLPYPRSVVLPQESNGPRSPQTPTQNTAGRIRDPSKTVMNALEDPLLPGSDWEFIPYEGKAGTETIGSQTTATNVDAAGINNTTGHAQSGLSKPNIEALNALGGDSASHSHKASRFATAYANVDKTSNSNMTASCHKPEYKDPYSPVSGPSAAVAVSYMESWAEENINKMNKE